MRAHESIAVVSLVALGALSYPGCNSKDGMFGPSGTGSGVGASGMGGGGPMPGAPFSALWARRYAAAGEQRVRGVGVDKSGRIDVTGQLQDSVTIGADTLMSKGSEDVLLFQLGSDGTATWSRSYGDAALQEVAAISVSPSDETIVIAGRFSGQLPEFGMGTGSSNIFEAQIDASGAYANRRQQNASDHIYGLGRDAQDHVLVAGDYLTTYDGGNNSTLTAVGGHDGFVAWQNPDLGRIQARNVGSTGEDAMLAASADSASNVYATGFVSAVPDVMSGLSYAGGKDLVLASWSANGDLRFAKLFGDAGDQVGRDVAVDANGHVIVVGDFSGTIDFGGTPLTSAGGLDVFVAAFDQNGAPLWSKRFGDASDQTARAVAIDSTGSILVTGDFEGVIDFGGGKLTSAGKTDVFLARFDDKGQYVQASGWGDKESQSGRDVTVDSGDHPILVADVQGEIDFGAGALPSVDTSYDIVVVKFAP